MKLWNSLAGHGWIDGAMTTEIAIHIVDRVAELQVISDLEIHQFLFIEAANRSF